MRLSISPRHRSPKPKQPFPGGKPQHQGDAGLFEGVDFLSPPRRLHHSFRSGTALTFGQAILLAAFASSVAAILTALTAVYFFYNHDAYATPRRIMHNNHQPHLPRPPVSLPVLRKKESSDSVPKVEPKPLASSRIDKDGIRPKVAWLMSFPNSGTSFTIHMTREASNCTTATNYALEGEIKDAPSVPAIPGVAGRQGPWLELIPDRHTSIPPSVILTKTHCKGFCNGPQCGPERTIQTPRSFQVGCLSGARAIETNRGIEKVDVTYSPRLVDRAIHIFRHPLDNIVARFNLDFDNQKARGNHKYMEAFPKNVTGFRRWCALDDQNKGLLTSRFLDRPIQQALSRIPCFNEFYRFVQWHNLAFTVSRDMNLTTMLLHYDEYSADFAKARDRVLDFLELPRVGDGIEFHSGKVYTNFYSLQERKAIRSFLQEYASHETWEQLERYDFATNKTVTKKG